MSLGRAPAVALAAAAALSAACIPGALRRMVQPVPYRMLRLGLERLAIPYDDRRAAEKRVLLERINRDRDRNGAPPVAYDPRGALVGDVFCLDSVLSGTFGHWDLEGRAPFVRWGLAGGVDFHAQNVAAVRTSSGKLERSLAELLLEAHEKMMAETPPDDGHRRTILDPTLTHVGIGAAVVGGEFRMTEEFTRVGFEWIELPDQALPAGSSAAFAGQPLEGLEVGAVEIRFEPPPQPLSPLELRRRRAYGYPAAVQTYRQRLPDGVSYEQRSDGEFEREPDGRVFLRFTLDSGPGFYFVVGYLHSGRGPEPLIASSAAMVTALP